MKFQETRLAPVFDLVGRGGDEGKSAEAVRFGRRGAGGLS